MVLASKGVMGAEIEMVLIERLPQIEEVSMDANVNVTVSPGLKGGLQMERDGQS